MILAVDSILRIDIDDTDSKMKITAFFLSVVAVNMPPTS